MTQTLSIRHTTSYRYDQPVPYALLQLRLRPKDQQGQEVLDWHVQVKGGKVETEYDDHHGNHVHLVSFDPFATEITIASEGQVKVEDTSGVLGAHQGWAPMWMFKRQTARTTLGEACKAIVSGLSGEIGSLDWLHALSAAIRASVVYEVGHSDVTWGAEEAAKSGHGVCQDHAHIFIACCRAAGRPARYVSGYLMMDRRTHQDATHAWAEAYVEGLGWVGFDVSNGISPDKRYVRVASGLDYADAAPVFGTRFGTARETMAVQLSVQQ